MKALLAIALVVSTLGSAREAAAAVWKGRIPKTVFLNNDPHIYQETFFYDARIEIVLDNGRDSIAVYHHLFHSNWEGESDFALSLYNTAREALMEGEPLWLLVQDDKRIVGVAVGPNDPSSYPLAVKMAGRRDIRKGAGGPTWVQVPGGNAVRDILGRTLRP